MHRERCPRALAITETQERLRRGTRLGKRKRPLVTGEPAWHPHSANVLGGTR